ncbi:MAG: flagellar export chaperone FliS [Chromatiales bacterium]|nr:flagellar export chaperone FliS [Chromatiales bacterium]
MTYGKKRSGVAQYGKVAAESEVAYASPHRLVQMLMEGALEKVATAKGCIERNDLEGKSRQITWAMSIINGLRTSLDMDAGGAIAVNLDDLYAYMTRRLIDASAQNDANALSEVIDLLLEIKGAWDTCSAGGAQCGRHKYAAARRSDRCLHRHPIARRRTGVPSRRMAELGDEGDWDAVVALEPAPAPFEEAFATHAPADEFVTDRVRAILDLDKRLMAQASGA